MSGFRRRRPKQRRGSPDFAGNRAQSTGRVARGCVGKSVRRRGDLWQWHGRRSTVATTVSQSADGGARALIESEAGRLRGLCAVTGWHRGLPDARPSLLARRAGGSHGGRRSSVTWRDNYGHIKRGVGGGGTRGAPRRCWEGPRESRGGRRRRRRAAARGRSRVWGRVMGASGSSWLGVEGSGRRRRGG